MEAVDDVMRQMTASACHDARQADDAGRDMAIVASPLPSSGDTTMVQRVCIGLPPIGSAGYAGAGACAGGDAMVRVDVM